MLRKLFQADLPTVLTIEQSSSATPWTDETFKVCMQAGHEGWVIELNGSVIGFIIMSLRMEESHILNLCIARQHQHQGYGRQLLLHAMQYAKQKGIVIIYLEVRRSNSRAIKLYEKEKFIQIGERKGYYPTVSGNEDALVFAKSLNEGRFD